MLRAILAVLIWATPAFAQSVVDESGGAIPEPLLAETMRAVTADFFDPLTAQFRSLSTAWSKSDPPRQHVCGWVNGKNRLGGYVGFAPFYFDATEKRAVIYTGADIADPTYRGTIDFRLNFAGCPDLLARR